MCAKRLLKIILAGIALRMRSIMSCVTTFWSEICGRCEFADWRGVSTQGADGGARYSRRPDNLQPPHWSVCVQVRSRTVLAAYLPYWCCQKGCLRCWHIHENHFRFLATQHLEPHALLSIMALSGSWFRSAECTFNKWVPSWITAPTMERGTKGQEQRGISPKHMHPDNSARHIEPGNTLWVMLMTWFSIYAHILFICDENIMVRFDIVLQLWCGICFGIDGRAAKEQPYTRHLYLQFTYQGILCWSWQAPRLSQATCLMKPKSHQDYDISDLASWFCCFQLLAP